MESQPFHRFTEAISSRLAARADVLGLVFLGSAAGVSRQPDAWSDHDFFVFVEDDAAERYRTDLSWLPPVPRLVLAHRETEHGLKLLLEGAHVCEVAVFTAAQRAYARGDTWRVAFDRGLDLEAVMRRQGRAAPPAADAAWSARQMLFALLVGAGRHRRGETLSAHRLVFGEALPRLIDLLSRGNADDPFDPRRRFETRAPAVAREIAATLLSPADAAALRLLEIAERRLAGTPAELPAEAVAQIRTRLR